MATGGDTVTDRRERILQFTPQVVPLGGLGVGWTSKIMSYERV